MMKKIIIGFTFILLMSYPLLGSEGYFYNSVTGEKNFNHYNGPISPELKHFKYTGLLKFEDELYFANTIGDFFPRRFISGHFPLLHIGAESHVDGFPSSDASCCAVYV